MTGDLFLLAAVNDPCKSLQSRRQLTKPVSKLVFYAQSTDAVISGRYTSHFFIFIFLIMCVCVLKWVYIQFLKPLRNQSNKSSNSSKSLRPSIKVSVWTFHRHKPQQVMSVTRLKFSRCMCKSCINPKMKVARLNVFD